MTATRERPFPIPSWCRRGCLRWTWVGGRGLTWYKRGGAHVETYTWLEEWHAHCFDPVNLDRLAAAGFNVVTVPYFAGFGSRVEGPWLDRAERLFERFAAHGIRCLAALDCGGICRETIFDEMAAAEDWILRDSDGRPQLASPIQYWRPRPDVTSPGYRDYLGTLIDRAIGAGAAGIWLHDIEPRHNYHPSALPAWRAFISDYTDFYRRKCGYGDYRHLDPPPFEVPGDPLWYDWDDFWQARFCEALADYNRRIKGHSAECLTVVSGPFQEVHPWERYRAHVDAVHWCNPWFPGVEHGEVVSQAALYLISDGAEVVAFGDGLRTEVGAFADPPVDRRVDLTLAEGMFFGGQPMSAAWATLPEGNHTAAPLQATLVRTAPWFCAFERGDREDRLATFSRFCERTEHLHRSTQSAATIAILHSRDSLRFDRDATVLNLRAAQLACLKRHLPADVLVSDDLAKLDGYDVLVVPEQPCLSRAALARVAAWVRAGGGLVLVGEAAVRARRGRLRPPDWLATTLGIGGSRWSLPNAEVVTAGSGRVLALPALGVEPFAYSADDPDPSAGWDWLPDAIHDVSAWPLPVTLDGPDTVFCRGYWLDNGNLSVMLINYGDVPADDLVLRLNLDWPAGVPAATLHQPSRSEPLELTPEQDLDGVRLELPPLDVYAVVEARATNGEPLEMKEAAEVPEGIEAVERA